MSGVKIKDKIKELDTVYVLSNYKYYSHTKEYALLYEMFNGENYVLEIQDPIYDDETDTFNAVLFSKNSPKNSRKSKKYQGDYLYVNFVGFFFHKDKNGVYDKCLVSFPVYASNYFVDGGLSTDVDPVILESYTERLSTMMSEYSESLERGDDLFRSIANDKFNILAYALRFFDAYATYGLYKEMQRVDSYSVGRTSWKKTVNRVLPDIIDGNIIYRKVIKERNVARDVDIGALQAAIFNHFVENNYHNIIKMMYKHKFNIRFNPIDTYVDIEKICKNETERQRWLKNVKDRRRQCFKDGDIKILDLLIEFLDNNMLGVDQQSSIYGVMKFDRVFEAALADYFGNNIMIHKRKQKGEKTFIEYTSTLPRKSKDKIDVTQAFFDLARYEIYFKEEDGVHFVVAREDRDDDEGNLIPDVVFEYGFDKNSSDISYVVIIDAKYKDYYIGDQVSDKKFEERHPYIPTYNLHGLPQNNDVMKQFHYETAIKNIYDTKLNAENRQINFINALMIPWKRSGDEEDYDGGGLVSGLNTFKIVGHVTYQNQILLYVLANFDAIANYLACNVKAKDNGHDEYLIDAATYYLKHCVNSEVEK